MQITGALSDSRLEVTDLLDRYIGNTTLFRGLHPCVPDNAPVEIFRQTPAVAIAISQDARVAFIEQDGAVAVGTPDTDPIVMTPDLNADLNPQPDASWGLERIDQRDLPLDDLYAYHNDGEGVNGLWIFFAPGVSIT